MSYLSGSNCVINRRWPVPDVLLVSVIAVGAIFTNHIATLGVSIQYHHALGQVALARAVDIPKLELRQVEVIIEHSQLYLYYWC